MLALDLGNFGLKIHNRSRFGLKIGAHCPEDRNPGSQALELGNVSGHVTSRRISGAAGGP